MNHLASQSLLRDRSRLNVEIQNFAKSLTSARVVELVVDVRCNQYMVRVELDAETWSRYSEKQIHLPDSYETTDGDILRVEYDREGDFLGHTVSARKGDFTSQPLQPYLSWDILGSLPTNSGRELSQISWSVGKGAGRNGASGSG